MEIIKYIFMILIIVTSTLLGFKISQKYKKREIELKEFKSALNMFKSKIKYTYETIPSTFLDISECFSGNVSNIFRMASEKMNFVSAGNAWNEALSNTYSSLNSEDKSVLKSLSKMLGKTDIDGQLQEIELTENFLDNQIAKAENERQKNEKMYKKLGLISGLGIVIILI